MILNAIDYGRTKAALNNFSFILLQLLNILYRKFPFVRETFQSRYLVILNQSVIKEISLYKKEMFSREVFIFAYSRI